MISTKFSGAPTTVVSKSKDKAQNLVAIKKSRKSKETYCSLVSKLGNDYLGAIQTSRLGIS